MPVTELALLRLKTQDPSPSAKSTALEAQKTLSEYSGHQVTYLRQIEDPESFYLLGGWESIEKHKEGGHSEANQNLHAKVKENFDISWMFHLDLDPSTSKIPLDAPIIAITRCFVEASKKDEFDAVFKVGVADLNAYTAPFTSRGAWRIDKEGEDEEFVLFSGWNQVQDHFDFAGSEVSKEFRKTQALMKGAEVKHVRIEKWE
ncbi:Dimeric alpha-beta barrel [Penicillium cf. griseofulvum]|uniref:Dimeric alpha-beta barrel n=1 Tax=Penicillium cf. griseofulvum TaxID=2972120 RepID=A0A9W9J2P2_9EURO|nr:Dimeric alpha-beta barrel [Penicillium cf. griseofulvum]KAJ5435242.1 Dimeric alpha-beta barrel [Penicillium cf. griseofulvum]KAJ5453076.1 Dimeric alpha-beta barrel [Penicillium cf. griseofulvum]